MSAIIYLLTNKVNGKIYIGQTSVGLEERWRGHCSSAVSGSNYHLHNAIRKYGPDAFIKEVLEHTTVVEVNDREIYWIAELQAREHGYNMTDGGEGMRGWSPSEDTRIKISLANKGRHAGKNHPMYGTQGGFYGKIHTQETKDKMRAAKLGQKFTEEHKANISIAQKGKVAGSNNPHYGKKHSEASRNKIREAIAGKLVGNKNGMYGKKHSEEAKEKMRAAKAARRMKRLTTQETIDQFS